MQQRERRGARDTQGPARGTAHSDPREARPRASEGLGFRPVGQKQAFRHAGDTVIFMILKTDGLSDKRALEG